MVSYDELIERVCELLPTKYANYPFEYHKSPIFALDGNEGDYYFMYRVADSDEQEYYKPYKGYEWVAETLYAVSKSPIKSSFVAHLFVYVFIKEYRMFFSNYEKQLNEYCLNAEREIKEEGFKWHNRCSRFIVYPVVDYELFKCLDPDSLEFAQVIVDTIDRSLELSVIELWDVKPSN